MLVDDDPLALAALTQTLRHYLSTVTVETFAEPASALRRLHAQSFAVVLTDFNMPGMDGITLLRAARESGSDASFIVMTGDSTDNIVTEGLRLGMFALVDKPLNRLALIALVQQAIEFHCLRREVADLRRTLRESGIALGEWMHSVSVVPDESQPFLPY